MPSRKSLRSKGKNRNRNKNPRVFRAVSNKTFNLLERSVKGVGNIGVGAVRLSGRIVSVGTGAANRVLGATKRIGSRITKRTRKSLTKK